jgi:phosphomannomutase
MVKLHSTTVTHPFFFPLAAVVPEEPVTLTPAKMFFIGNAYAEWLSLALNLPTSALRVSVGRDSRLSSPLMAASLVAGLATRGVAVARFGMCTTPAMFMSCVLPGHGYDGAAMITASHLPVNRNGVKFFRAAGGLGKPDIKWILHRAAELAASENVPPSDPYSDTAYVLSAALLSAGALISYVDFLEVYAAHLRNVVIDGVNHPVHSDKPLKGFKIVVNPGNGAGGFFATRVLAPLGADTSASIYLEPDGRFPHHPPNPENKAAVEATKKAVLAAQADLGIVLDTDVDRSGFVDANGNAINRNRYIALMAAIALRDNPEETIVTDSCTSNGLASFIEELGGKHFRYKKG